jgi:hypothetical protein
LASQGDDIAPPDQAKSPLWVSDALRGRGGAACRRHRLRASGPGTWPPAGGRRRQGARGRRQSCCARRQQACRQASATAGSPRSFLGRVRRCSAPAAAAERRAPGIAAAQSAAGSLPGRGRSMGCADLPRVFASIWISLSCSNTSMQLSSGVVRRRITGWTLIHTQHDSHPKGIHGAPACKTTGCADVAQARGSPPGGRRSGWNGEAPPCSHAQSTLY